MLKGISYIIQVNYFWHVTPHPSNAMMDARVRKIEKEFDIVGTRHDSDNLGCKKLITVHSSLRNSFGAACETKPREQCLTESLLDVSLEDLQSYEP